MTNSKKKKIKISATSEGVNKAEKALVRLGFGTKANFAKSTLISRNVVTNFFLEREIQVDSFQRICEKLTLDWKKIAKLSVEAPLTSVASPAKELTEVKEDMQSISISITQVTVKDKQSDTTKAVITLQGDLDSVENLNILATIIKQYGGDTIVIEKLKQGSIKIFISGSPEDIERLKSRIESGEIEEINGFPVENIEVTRTNNKWCLVEEIVNHPSKGRSLKSVDLSDADLSGADLSSADLSDADLSDADLSGADLSGANLVNSNLRNAHLKNTILWGANLEKSNLENADLENAYIVDANLKEANLIGANLIGAKLGLAYLNWNEVKRINPLINIPLFAYQKLMDTYHKILGIGCSDLQPTRFSGAKYSDKTKFPKCRRGRDEFNPISAEMEKVDD